MQTRTPIDDKALINFYKNNPDFEVSNFQFHDHKAVNSLLTEIKSNGSSHEAATEVIDHLKTYHRLLKVHPDAELAKKLKESGFVSANHIAKTPPSLFVKQYADKLGLTKKEALGLHKNANTARTNSMHLWASVRGTVASPVFRNSSYGVLNPEVSEAFENLPSYSDLFGSIDYCECEECNSIFGPAAYLVDLLRIIEDYVVKPNNISKEFLFSTRRPDIANIPLTCSNTNSLVPTIQIVNEVLLNYLIQNVPGVPPSPATKEQQQDYVLQQMANDIDYPSLLPFNVPLAQIKGLIGNTDTNLSAVFSAWQVDPNIAAAVDLGLSPEQQSIVTTANATEDAIKKFYNVTASTKLSVPDVFTNRLQINFEDLLDLLNQDLSIEEQKAGLQVNFFINQGIPNSKYLNTENGTITPNPIPLNALDQINRIFRLSLTSGITISTLDWVLRSAQGGYKAPVINNANLEILSQLNGLATSLSTSLENAATLLGPIKTYGTNSAFDLLFNSPALVAQFGIYHPKDNKLNPTYETSPLPWTSNASTNDNVSAISRILPGLGIGLQDANSLGNLLFGKNQVSLDVDTISSLYRHVLILNSLQLPMQSYVVLVKLINPSKLTNPTLEEISDLITLAEALDKTGASVYDLDYIVNNHSTIYVNTPYDASQVPEWQSNLITTLTSADPSTKSDAICSQIATLFGVDQEIINAIMEMIMSQPGEKSVKWEASFLDKKKLAFVESTLNIISRWLLLYQTLKLSTRMIDSMKDQPAVYQLDAKKMLAAPALSAINSIYTINKLMTNYGDQQQKLVDAIDLLPPTPWKNPINNEEKILILLNDATGWDSESIKELMSLFDISSLNQIPDLLIKLQTCFNIMSSLGADTGLMSSIVSLAGLASTDQNWTTYKNTSDNLLSVSASMYGSDWRQISNTLTGNLAIKQRDAMLSMVLSFLNTMDSSIQSNQNVYEYLLTNVEIGADAETSYIVEATAAAQLYLQRCRLMLEPGVTDLLDIGSRWWEWMLNYRVWQANREIFLYPENYMIPGLQQLTTPQFKSLAQTLQQTNISPSSSDNSFINSANQNGQNANVENAYVTYMQGFGEISDIQVVDSHYTKVGNQVVLYLLGRTKTSPYTFYYCYRPDGEPWTAWEKIDITVNADTGSLVYAFNRQFLFWVEIHNNNSSTVTGAKDSDINTNYVTSATASVMYSFIDINGKWVQPQVLVNKNTIYYNSDAYKDKKTPLDDPLFDGLYDFKNSLWNNVRAIRITKENYSGTNVNSPEKLVVMWGPNLNAVGKLDDSSYIVPEPIDPVAENFWKNLNQQEENNFRLIHGQLSGEINLQPNTVLNFTLKDDVLVNNEELILTDSYQTNYKPGLRAGITSNGSTLLVTSSSKVITDSRIDIRASNPDLNSNGVSLLNPNSRTCQAFAVNGITIEQSQAICDALQKTSPPVVDVDGNVDPSALDSLNLYQALEGLSVFDSFGPAQYQSILAVINSSISATSLFDTLSKYYSEVIPVDGQPGWFLTFLDDESFLLYLSNSQNFSSFSDGISLSAPLVSPSFATGYTDITEDISKNIYDQLSSKGIITDGVLNESDTLYSDVIGILKLITGIDPGLYNPIYSCLVNGPILFKDSFIAEKIDLDISTAIFAALQGKEALLLDENGRITQKPYILTYNNVENWLSDVKDAQGDPIALSVNQIASVYQTLISAPLPITLNYSNKNKVVAIGDLIFKVTRLSTSAISNLNQSLFAGGVPLLLSLPSQQIPVIPNKSFFRFDPSSNIEMPVSLDATQADFDVDGLYSQYFWEIFYSIPTLVAYTLSTQQQFQVAQIWLQYIFNPTVPSFGGVTADLLHDQTEEQISKTDAASIISKLQNPVNGIKSFTILDSKFIVNPSFNSETDLGFVTPTITGQQSQLLQGLLLSCQEQSDPATSEIIQQQIGLTDAQTSALVGLLQNTKIDSSPILDQDGSVNLAFKPSTSLDFLQPTIPATQNIMIANILINNQLSCAAANCWQFFPFRNHTLESLIGIFNNTQAVQSYQNRPFDPFTIARLRIGAHEKATFMQYVNNLIAWGDQLFTQDTRESITAAYMIYQYANDLLGSRPTMVGECDSNNNELTFNDILQAYPSGIPPFLIDLELFPSHSGVSPSALDYAFNDLPVYFKVPENDNLLALWDTVEDRIGKINKSENIDGVFQQLPLFQPPINPLDLVKAGGNINSVLNKLNGNIDLPYFRYSSSLEKATRLCDIVIDLGNALQSALERGDAEGLSMLQSSQQAQTLQKILQIKQSSISEIQSSIDSLNANLKSAEIQLSYYTNLISGGLSDYEITNIGASTMAMEFNVLSSITQTASSIGYAVPQAGSPFAMTYGGEQLGSSLMAAAGVFGIGAQISSYVAQLALTMGGYDRRNQEWVYQQELAQEQIANINAQIEATKSRLEGAQQDMESQQLAITQNDEMTAYLKDKFTNQELYQWMVGQLGSTYYQTYNLAVKAAQQAEACYQFELDSEKAFVNFDYWNNLYKGLTAGQGLRLALNNLDAAYREGNQRRLEIEKTVSLAMTSPEALLALKSTGKCSFTFNESMFDYDYPGHYARKISSLAISVPVVLGPYQNLKATLTQNWNCIVTGNNDQGATNQPSIDNVKTLLNKPNTKPSPTTGMRVNWAHPDQSIAISTGVNDPGVFQLDFNDPRYLPFENTGAVSNWILSMPKESNFFDFDQISDVIITIKYTALCGPEDFQNKVKTALSSQPLPGGLFVDCNAQGSSWQSFLMQGNTTGGSKITDQNLNMMIPSVKVSAFKKLTFTSVIVQLVVADGIQIQNNASFLSLKVDPVTASPVVLKFNNKLQASLPGLKWDGLKMGDSWAFEFNLEDPKIGPLLTNGVIDGSKLLNMQIIALYDASIY
ncbi:MAG: hypothetical protein JXQ90_15845 [Cyclobacteriaceae bacterium]